MAKKTTGLKKTKRNRFSTEFKQQALLRAVKGGVPAVAQELGLEPAQLYAWRSKAQQQGQNEEAQRLQQSELARAHVFEYIEIDYNRNRLHSTLGYLSPEQFELAKAA